MDPSVATPKNVELAQTLIESLFSHYGIIFLFGVIVLAFRQMIENTVSALMMFFFSDLDLDDIVYLSGRKARIVRIGLRKTVFYMLDTDTKMVVPNIQLKELTMEKKLNNNEKYLIDKE